MVSPRTDSALDASPARPVALALVHDEHKPVHDPAPDDHPEFNVPVDVVSRRYNLNERLVQEMCLDGRLEAMLIGGRWRIKSNYPERLKKLSDEKRSERLKRLAERRETRRKEQAAARMRLKAQATAASG